MVAIHRDWRREIRGGVTVLDRQYVGFGDFFLTMTSKIVLWVSYFVVHVNSWTLTKWFNSVKEKTILSKVKIRGKYYLIEAPPHTGSWFFYTVQMAAINTWPSDQNSNWYGFSQRKLIKIKDTLRSKIPSHPGFSVPLNSTEWRQCWYWPLEEKSDHEIK